MNKKPDIRTVLIFTIVICKNAIAMLINMEGLQGFDFELSRNFLLFLQNYSLRKSASDERYVGFMM